jgi:hypothetical protein
VKGKRVFSSYWCGKASCLLKMIRLVFNMCMTPDTHSSLINFDDLSRCFVQIFEGPQNSEGLAPETIAKKRAYEDARPTFSSQSYPRGMKE